MAVKTAGKTRSRTRDRVLDAAHALFNETGIARVTTAEIADAARINEGNLYYYFQRKEHLAEALFSRFEAALVEAADEKLADPADLASYAAYQQGWFRLMWEFRYFYRDGSMLRGFAPALRDRLRALNVTGQSAVRRVLEEMQANGLLAISPAELDALIKNLWIVSAYWMDFRLTETADRPITQDDLAWGFFQVEVLYRPYLVKKGWVE